MGMGKKRALSLLLLAVAFCLAGFSVWAVCTGTGSFTLTVYNPGGGAESSCTGTIIPEGGINCDQGSSSACTATATCGMIGDYTASISSCSHINGCSLSTVTVLSCSYDDSEAICKSVPGQQWVNGGESSPFGGYDPSGELGCCADDAGEYYLLADVGVENRCCNSLTDCVINGVCVTSGEVYGGYRCGGGSLIPCDAASECTIYGSATCYYDSGYTWGTPPSGEDCTDGHDNDCDGLIDYAGPDCCECSSGPCCDGCHYRPAGTVCSNEDGCSGNMLCTYMTCNAVGGCTSLAGCAACPTGTKVNECGAGIGSCLVQIGDDICQAVADDTLCCDTYADCCDRYCQGSDYSCRLWSPGPCEYVYSRCVSIANDPDPGQEPSDPGQCFCHTLWQSC